MSMTSMQGPETGVNNIVQCLLDVLIMLCTRFFGVGVQDEGYEAE